MRRLKNESGSAMFLVMMVIMVMLLISGAALTRTAGSRVRSFEQKKMVQSSYVAEAGAEKALAYIRSDFEWLKSLTPNEAMDEDLFTSFIFEENGDTSLEYGDGQITSVKISRTSIGENPTRFYIESKGDYQGATRTIKVTGEMYDPVDFGRGVWVKGGTSLFSNNTVYNSDITSQGSLIFNNNVTLNGNILSAGSIILRNNATATSIVSGQDVEIYNNVTANVVYAGRDINLHENAGINGIANAIRNVSLLNNANISQDVFYNGTLTLGPGATTGITHPGSAVSVGVNVPAFPVLEESLYSQYPDPAPSGTLSGDFTLNGIYYAPGDLNITGTYNGNGMIVTHGIVNITGDLLRANENSSLVIVSFGKVENVGILVTADKNNEVCALLYTPNTIFMDNNAVFRGSLVCNNVIINNNSVVTYDVALPNNQPKWMTTVVKVKSWSEAEPVF